MEDVLKKIRVFFFKTGPSIFNCLFVDFFKSECNNCNIKKNQYKTILILKNHGPKSMTDLCSMLHLEKGSLTTIIDHLTQQGYVVRIKDEKDRRKYLINLTSKGMEFAEYQLNRLNEHLNEKFKNLSKDDMNKFLDAIETFEYILNKL
ncbi:MarR family winged helix-turn-helix transcriptional regulator [Tepidibacter thalassicus]|uniref:DNA-binding transcriptional regulator, MarR family n=1 Tax=Tepidibacter thalassicus DSM 15285 TaxID=1123350 RepID=A0A1M5QL04_9FIRM|nr:MarR family transcriptional regulator [Tepidibacter thalassicus]SHH14450.1 DNA-binding transcriptional regulator, MarR family [Tepidibacter thalassicus DSM 15285]